MKHSSLVYRQVKSPANKSQTVGKIKRSSINQRVLTNYHANNKLLNMLVPIISPSMKAYQPQPLPSMIVREQVISKDYEEFDLILNSNNNGSGAIN